MTRGFDQNDFLAGKMEDFNRRRTPNQSIAIDPAIFGTQDSTAMRSQDSRDSYGGHARQSNNHQIRRRYPGDFPTSQEDARAMLREKEDARAMRRENSQMSPRLDIAQPSQQSPYQSYSRYPDAGLIDRSGIRNGVLHSNVITESRVASTVLQTRMDANIPAPKETIKRVTRSSKKRTSADAGLSADAEDVLEDPTTKSRRSTRRSKRTKVPPKYNDTGDEGEEKIRKVSKLNAKIAEGKGPKKGSLGPNGEVRIREDGRMEFRDVNNPEWTLAAYHNDNRRQFLDEAAELGEFDHTPARGEADDDETSYEPEQQSWGPSRSDWQNIVNAEGKKVMFEVDQPASRRPPHDPSNWIHDGLVLLDSKNHPVKDWPGLNKTLSTEIESWRWEALMRVYPWLTVADLLARMPRTREKKGEVLPLQTPQAFTNRAYRFRVPNQIPASNPKSGSETYKGEIVKNLAKKGMKTTEGLSTLNPDQVKKVRKGNKGKFKENSRYVVKEDEESAEASVPTKKRKAHCDDDIESETEQEAPKVKRPRTRAPPSLGEEVHDLNPEIIYDNADQDVYLGSAGFYDEPTDTAGIWDNQEEEVYPRYIAGSWQDQNGEDLVPLFLTNYDLELALATDESFTSPEAVIWARRNGDQQTGQICVCWYRRSAPRHVRADGIIVEDVVDSLFWDQYEAQEPIPGDDQLTSELDGAHDVASSFTQNNVPPIFDPLFDGPSYEGHQDFLRQTSDNPQMPAVPNSQAPPSVPNQIGRYQTRSDIAEEVWRNHHGSTGF